MVGFRRKKTPAAGSEDLLGIRNCLEDLTGEAMNVYMGTFVGYVLKLGKTPEDVEKAKARMLSCLRRFVRVEILLDRQSRGQEPEVADLEGLRMD